MVIQNTNFIPDMCERCGKADDFVTTEIYMRCGYGSIYDGDEIRLSVCGDCADEIMQVILNEKGKVM